MPEDSDSEAYDVSPQPKLEGTILVNGSPRVLACRDQPTTLKEEVTTLTKEVLDELVEQYRMEGRIVLSLPHMRCYRFDHEENRGRIPRMVLSANMLKVRVVSPLIRNVYESTTSPQSRSTPTLTDPCSLSNIIYHQQGFPPLEGNTLNYFLQLKKSNKRNFGYVYFSVWPEFNRKNLVFGTPSNAKSWKGPYFYVHDVHKVKTSFNYNPGNEADPFSL